MEGKTSHESATRPETVKTAGDRVGWYPPDRAALRRFCIGKLRELTGPWQNLDPDSTATASDPETVGIVLDEADGALGVVLGVAFLTVREIGRVATFWRTICRTCHAVEITNPHNYPREWMLEHARDCHDVDGELYFDVNRDLDPHQEPCSCFRSFAVLEVTEP